MIRIAAVVLLTLVPFAVSILAAYAAWESIRGIWILWRMIAMTLVWIGAFASGAQLFWKVVERLAQ
ncbi:MAG TPA: hypothetical protein VEH01_02070 [Nitrososphaerales archaeon]|nr:hypothetical protein [Nitrososphaerales archaeon]